jgi:cytoskeletal protein RodZ
LTAAPAAATAATAEASPPAAARQLPAQLSSRCRKRVTAGRGRADESRLQKVGMKFNLFFKKWTSHASAEAVFK